MKTTTNPSTTDWEKEFDEHFDEVFEMTRNRDFKDCSASVKFFIRTLLSRKEEEVRKEVGGMVLDSLGTLFALYEFTEPERRIMPHLKTLYEYVEYAMNTKKDCCEKCQKTCLWSPQNPVPRYCPCHIDSTKKFGIDVVVCPIHDNTHYCRFKILTAPNGKCECVCTCLAAPQHTSFSDFFHNASPEEKERVMLEVAREATNEQRKQVGLPPLHTSPEKEEHPIEAAYPDAYRLARKFHDLYEEYAPQFGYETRQDTKAFDPGSPNGRTMAKVAYEMAREIRAERTREITDQIHSLLIEIEKSGASEYITGKVVSLADLRQSLLTSLAEELTQ